MTQHSLTVQHPFLDAIALEDQPRSYGAYAAMYYSQCGQYVIKVPYNHDTEFHTANAGGMWGETYQHLMDGTSSSLGHNYKVTPKPRHYEQYIICQAERMHMVSEAYRLQSFGLGTIAELRLDCLVMQRYDAVAFTDLTLKDWFRYLPAVLSALCEYPHGNLSPRHILVDKDDGTVRLASPGSMVVERNFNIKKDLDYTCYYFVNPNNYPLLAPSFFMRRKNCLSDCYKASELIPIPDPFRQQYCPEYESPDVADLLALGIMLYLKATGVQLFREFTSAPLWMYESSSSYPGYRLLNRGDLPADLHEQELRRFNQEYGSYLHHLTDSVPQPLTLNSELSEAESRFIHELVQGDSSFDMLMEQLLNLR